MKYFFCEAMRGVMKYIDKARTKSKEEAAAWIQMILDNLDTSQAINWGITLKNEHKLIGNICLWNIQPEHCRAELGYVLHPEFHGKGMMNEAIREVLKYGFETMKLHSVEAIINPANKASASVLEKNNFVREAYFRENHYYDGNFLDSAVYSLLAPATHREFVEERATQASTIST